MMSCFYLLKLQQITYYRSLLFFFKILFLREFTRYAVFKVRSGGLKWTRTTDLTLIRRAL